MKRFYSMASYASQVVDAASESWYGTTPTSPSEQMKTSVDALVTNLKNLNEAIMTFPETGGTMMQAMSLQNLTIKLVLSITKAKNAVLAVNNTDPATTLKVWENLKEIIPTIPESLYLLTNRRDSIYDFSYMGGPTIMREQLQALHEETINISNVLRPLLPPEEQPISAALTDMLDKAFIDARNVFGVQQPPDATASTPPADTPNTT